MTDSGPVSIADICHNFSSKSYYVICLDDNKRVRIRKVIQAKSSGFTNQLIKITTHTGAQFECTPNHKWITETGWVPAESLKPGTKLIGIHSFHSESIGFEAVESILIAAVDFIQCDSIEVFDIEVDGVHNFVITDGSDLGPVVHNSEFLHVDNTACNLCAINLTKFFNDDKFDFERFSQSIRLFVTAQNAIIDKADYPTQAIGDGSHKLRPIGLNYGDLGALIMDRGYSYDSDEGRAIAARMASLMTGLAYLTSAKLASRVGAFSDFEKNRDEMLHVMWMHQHADSNILKCWNLEEDPIGSDVVLKSSEIWSEVIYYGEKYGYTISQASVQAPLGCLVAGSFVSTDQGMIRIEDIGDPNGAQWQDINLQVHTDDGPQKATKFYVNGVDDIIEVITENGYVLRGTPKHQIKIVDSDGNWIWRRFDRLEPGDTVPLAMKQHVGSIYSVRLPPCPAPYWAVNGRGVKTPEVLDTRLAELIGMFSANGSVHHKGLKFAIDPSDKDVIEKYASFLRDLFGIDPTVQKSECVNLCLNSTQIRSWWDAAGFSKICLDDGKLIARIPDAILRSNNPEIYGAYLRGLFTGDGSASNGLPSITNKNYEFLSDIQVLLLFLGIPTRRDFNLGGNDKKPVWRLTVSSLLFSSVFLEKVGFSSSRKSNKIHVAETWSKADYIPIGQTLLDKVCPIESDHRKDFVRHIQENNGVARHLCFKIVRNAELSKLLDFYYDKIKSTELIGRQSTYDISVPGNTTYIANGFISHNTVSFLMGMNTTGIEPAYSLVSYKSLVGGGFMKITNQNVKNGLKSLGYSGHKISSICKYIEDHDCIEGSPDLKPEHLPVFDCAMPSGHSSRHLSPMAHIKMMAAIQPLITCAMSKTINIPNSASINEIADLYMESWKLGLKCVSVYRDGCKLSQPLATKSRVNEQNGAREERKSDPGSQRRRLPEDISGHRHQFEIDGFKGYIMTNEYPDGLPGEVFIRLGKPGSTVNGLIDGFTKLLSIALQYGVPLEKLIQSFIDTRFEPAGITKNSKIRFAKSIYDYLFRYLDYRYNKSEISQNPELKAEPESDPQISISKNHNSIHPISRKNFDGPPCVHCGAITRRNGSCWLCDVCGNTTGGCS
jgi:ribonucleoside-diphosphate reductase alpha chain